VRVIGEKGENLGILSLEKALRLARPDEGLDLIEISGGAKPPVCRLMSFDKYRYEMEKKEKKERQTQKSAGPKQIQISGRAAHHDLLIKIRQLEEFLNEGRQVEIQMRLRGREKFHKDWARQKLEEFLKMITIEHKLITPPKFGGRGMIAQITKK
jgi:translation initiation factor IF-3